MRTPALRPCDAHRPCVAMTWASLTRRLAAALALAGLATLAPSLAAPAAAEDTTAVTASQAEAARPSPPGRTGLPLPRFVSLRASEVNLRSGPGTRYPIDWVYRRSGMPVEIIDEFDTWRRIRDWQGTEGWVHQSMVQGRRSVLITGQRRTLKRRPEAAAPGVAMLDAGVIAALERCRDGWCEVSAGGYSGWLPRDSFYGLYPDEEPR
ncbi:SH3 domain-containing protein [Pelagibius sp.]|uniref:SH3 domain-containing protein n=1 Tax=Pelagibius sp. TaxID=1931238 RepID=UPI0026027529|nr:SH3 domain-containing protein [Pelagibius sp.]